MNGEYIGSDFDVFLEEEDLLADVEVAAIKRVITYQISQEIDRTISE